jgi:hypothetical protein
LKAVSDRSQAELAAFVQTHLRAQGIDAVLSGGASVAIYSDGQYVSMDIDLVNAKFAARKKIVEAMKEIGFTETGRHFGHPDTDYFVEFQPGPLSIGDKSIDEVSELSFDTGILRIISPTDCIKDRLAHYFHWGDRQCLAQAEMVAARSQIDIDDIEDWSRSEGKLKEFVSIRSGLGYVPLKPLGQDKKRNKDHG